MADIFSAADEYDAMSLVDLDVCGAMLIHFCFGPLCNKHVIQNCKVMLRDMLKMGYHAARAFLNRGQSSLLNRYDFMIISSLHAEAFVNEVYQRQKKHLDSFVQRVLQKLNDAASLIKRLIQRNAANLYVQLV